ncbi:MAG: hypothetical protein JXR50_00955 [Prolixibacteraceae bacterium]|nr:hypothetical protein [Prolixibacteraceae bacterium]MBN2648291.1 hypothetical protein [Prolixibacteraceae bacterium]
MEDTKQIILTQLIDALKQKDVDFEAWKLKASLVLKQLFDPNDEKITLINELHYDYSSWSLRDGSGGKQHDPVKESAKEILEAAKLELQLNNADPILSVLQEKLSGNEYNSLLNMIKNSETEDELISFFSKIAPTIKDAILAKMILKK